FRPRAHQAGPHQPSAQPASAHSAAAAARAMASRPAAEALRAERRRRAETAETLVDIFESKMLQQERGQAHRTIMLYHNKHGMPPGRQSPPAAFSATFAETLALRGLQCLPHPARPAPTP